MSAVMTAALMNAACASILACVVALACRWIKRPAAAHVLWLVVLLELLGPPVFRVGVVPPAVRTWIAAQPDRPATQAEPVSSVAATGWGPAAPAQVPLATDRRTGPVVPLSGRGFVVAALGLWAGGAVVLLSLTVVRGRRFARLLAFAASPSPGLEEHVSRLARRMGVSRPPPVRLVAARISPMLRPRLGRVELLFPAGLLARLDGFERDTLLAHELAHVRRRDHWVRALELVTVALFWWHPVAWWTRARLRRAEEQACDAWVVQTLPTRSQSYARALVKTVEFLAGAERPLPALASGLGEVHHLKERLTMIARSSRAPGLSRPWRAALALAALAAVLIFPTWAEPPAAEEETAAPDADARYRESLRELEQEAAALESELRAVHARRMEIEREWQQRHLGTELDRLRSEVELERAAMQRDVERQIAALQESIEHAAVASGELRERGDEAAAEALEAEQRALERRLESVAAEAETRARRLQAAQFEAEIQHMRATAEHLREEGRDEEATDVERQLDLLRMEMNARSWTQEDIDNAQRWADLLEAQGDDAEAAEIRALIDLLLESMEDDPAIVQ
jgi:beta-lactamase regulating signal transducer with metallopeptidase domain